MSQAHRNHRWTTHRRRRRTIAAANNEPCSICGQPIDYTLHGNHRWAGTVEHTTPLALGGELLPPLDQLAIAHRYCQGHQGAAISNAIQGLGPGSRGGNPDTYTKRSGKRKSRNGNRKRNPNGNENGNETESIYSARESITPRQGGIQKNQQGSPLITNNPKDWESILRNQPESGGMQPMRHPDGWVLPRIWTPADVPKSYVLADRGLQSMCRPGTPGGPPLLPWAAFYTRELLAVHDDGGWEWDARADRFVGSPRLVYGQSVLRVTRQEGKTWWARKFLTWWLFEGSRLLNWPQRIVNTHFDGAQAKRLMVQVARSMGFGRGQSPGLFEQPFMAIWHPGGVEDDAAAVWMARAMTMNALTGNTAVSTAFVDELQDARARQVREALGGSMSGARLPNRLRLYAGTGEKEGSEVLRALRRLIGSLRMLWAEWSLPPGADPDDEAGWEWGSPDWSEGRLEFLREERDALADDLGVFRRNYLLLDDVPRDVAGWVEAGLWGRCGRAGLVVPAARGVVGLALDESEGSWPVVVANRVDGGVGVRLAGVFGSQGEAEEAAAGEAAGRGALLLTPQHGLRGQVRVRGVRESLHFHEGDVASALALCRVWVGRGELVFPAGDGVEDAVLGVPVKREFRAYPAGVLALVCAWWAHKHRPVAAAA